ncbi:putative ribonuclease H-like domain-containing protein [Tanacetum coccineum]
MVIDSPYYSVYEELASPEQTATGKDMLNPLYGCDGLPKTVRVFQFTLDLRSEKLDWFLLHQGVFFTKVSTSPRVSSYLLKAYQIYLCCCKDWKLLFFDVATSFDSAVHRVYAVSFDADVLDVASTVFAACIVAASYIVSAGICDAAEFMLEDLEAVPADYVPAGHKTWSLNLQNSGTTTKLSILKLENGNSWVSIPQTTQENGTSFTKTYVHVTAEEKTNKKNDVKAISLLLMALPNEHQLTFSQYPDAKSIFATIETRFGESLDFIFNMLQKIVSRLAILDVVIAQPEVETMSIDDLYNNFKIVEKKVKKFVGSSSGAQNLAFMTALNTSSNYDVNTASPQVSTASPNVNTASPQVSTGSLSDNTMYDFMVENPNGSDLLHQDLEQIRKDDLEAMDLKWQLSLLSMRAKRYYHRIGKKIFINANDTAGYDKSKVECFNYHKIGHFARECRAPRSKEDSGLDEFKEHEFKGYGTENSKQESNIVSDKKLDDSKKSSNDYLVKEQVLKDTNSFVKSLLNVDKETIFPVDKKARCKYHQRERMVYGNNYNMVNYNYTTKRTHPNAQRNMVPRAVLMKIGLKPFNTAKKVNTTHPKSTVFSAKPMSCFSKTAQSTVRRPFQTKTALYNKRFRQAVNTAKAQAVNTARPKVVKTARPNSTVVNAIRVNQENDVKASACWESHNKMTHDLLIVDAQGTLKTDILEFEDVYFVNELKFNLFSVSQMCDKKNYVLFTDTECLVLSPNFKLPDESQILLKIPRKDNMYSFDMKNIVPKESLTCLVAKATSDESMLWHRRLGHISHINFKNINKLVKDNLVRGLPTKRFENDQTCVACLKGKQHRASSERRNRTLIEAARTLLADSKLPTIFWAEAISTACYVQNRVLVVKPHNKTPYELFRGFQPALSFMRPFGWHVTILNTLNSLGKFDGKSDEENKPMIEGNGPKWLFDINSLTQSMNYVPVAAGTIINESAGTQGEINADDSSTKDINAAGQHVNTASPEVNTVDPSVNTASSNDQDSPKYMFTMGASHTLEATHVEFFNDDEEPEVDLGNITNSYTILTTPNTRIHKDHPIENMIGDVKSYVQIRRMTKPTSEQGFLSDVYEGKTHEDLHTCLFSCFLSQEEQKRISKALSDPAWVEAMQEELLQLKLQKVWILMDLPKGHRAIGTKWIFRNKKDKRGIVIRNKARLIEEEVYVCQPPGFEDFDYPDKVYKVVKALYEGTSFTSIRRIHQEDTAYPCLYFTRNHKDIKTNTPYPEASIRRIQGLLYTKILEDIKRAPYFKKAQYVIWYDEDVHELRSVETEFPAIVFNDSLTFEGTFSCEPTDSENDNVKVNMPSFPSPEPRVSYFDELDLFKDFKNEFPAIVYNDALKSKSDFLTEPTISIQHIDEFNLKDETSLSECDEVEQNVLYFNDVFPFNVIYPDDSKSDKDNDDDKIDIKQSSGGNVINTELGAYAQGSNKLLETSHDTSNKFFKTEIFIVELNLNIMTCNYIIKGMLINLFKNLYVPFGTPFDPKLFYKDGVKLGQV